MYTVNYSIFWSIFYLYKTQAYIFEKYSLFIVPALLNHVYFLIRLIRDLIVLIQISI